MKQKIIEECKKYGYELNYERNELLSFTNENVNEYLQIFHVRVYESINLVQMALMIDMGSWSEASDSDLDNEEEVLNNIRIWLNEDNLNSMLEWFDN